MEPTRMKAGAPPRVELAAQAKRNRRKIAKVRPIAVNDQNQIGAYAPIKP
jgi:hypothetical protein